MSNNSNVKHSSSNENEHIEVSLLVNKTRQVVGKLVLSDESPVDPEMVFLQLSFEGNTITSQSENYFTALQLLRVKLEERNTQILCNGAAINIYPSRMQLEMGVGRLAYKLHHSVPAKMADVIDIFDLDDELEFVTVTEQTNYYQQWMNSILSDR
ncbi:hypothetical protein [Paenibacillus sacheonensis]|uniref:Uncharacterized protein n=1 Tax=Paenibacillus sacheonensis TaxID=742054 RepID=A0A7X4YW06_9BACL|nr:hypothetical protein [Paenibacillus sacheonensis]MBM7569524.1 hypothetical protein [Paenibacillus sacheonensis]NBC73583.1 hypothetical protein [Paenibacillus sacheonensis]